MTPRTITYSGSGSVVFHNLVPGKGFTVTATNHLGCVSAPTDCTNYTTNSCTSASRVAPASPVAEIKPVTKVTAFPNPFSDKINFMIESAVTGKGTLELFNFSGQKLRTVYQGVIQSGKGQTIQFDVPFAERSNLIYVLTVGKEKHSGKLIQAD
jgi:hypothetical protein